jgi:hypothetical protein
MKLGDLCMIVHPGWREWSDSGVCMILRPVSHEDGIDIYSHCDWWVMWDGRETAWAKTDLEPIE